MVPFIKKLLPWNTGIALNTVGIVIHETASNGDSCDAEYGYIRDCLAGKYPDDNGHCFAHMYCDDTKIMQFAPLNKECYHACSPANEMFVGIECCHVRDGSPGAADRFNVIYESVAEWAAYYLRVICGVTVVTNENCMSHHEVTLKWKNSDHVDPTDYFAMYGKNMDMFRERVRYYISIELAWNKRMDTVNFW